MRRLQIIQRRDGIVLHVPRRSCRARRMLVGKRRRVSRWYGLAFCWKMGGIWRLTIIPLFFSSGTLLCFEHKSTLPETESGHAGGASDHSPVGAHVCGVCFKSNDVGYLTCDGCLCTVHPECYGLLDSETPLDRSACVLLMTFVWACVEF